MKPSSIFTAFSIILAASAAALPGAAISNVAVTNTTLLEGPPPGEDLPDAWCSIHAPGFVFDYHVTIREVDDVGASFVYKKGLDWKFRVGLGCDMGCVQSAFWEATHNAFGAMDVSGCDSG
ncbi:hypothetical protein J7T55_013765 [Diaporthe amygdali]|uniref:uncharacterized protein n=1 Tax=Phomopsis amygdali TaxID=1214568 RepID=UPI0022FF2040|nr:uncharacterized protein J7T55_013765 [Diaporthe amygdali]KAJ0119562.1 hypothetical protein J7T55_013765 [Diaporthe amygdali]